MAAFDKYRAAYPKGMGDWAIIEDLAKANDTTPEKLGGYFGIEAPSFTGEFSRAVPRGLAQMEAGVGMVAQDLGWKDNPILRHAQGVIERNPTAINSLEDVANYPTAALGSAGGNMVSFLGPQIGVRAGGALLGRVAAARGLQAAMEAGALTPEAAAAARAAGISRAAALETGAQTAVAGVPSYAGIREQQIEGGSNNWYDPFVAGAASLGVGAIENRFGLQRMMGLTGPKIAERELLREFGKTPLRTVGKVAGRGALEEGLEEIPQNVIEQLAAYQDPTTAKSLEDTAMSGVMGGLGGLFGGAPVGGYRGLQHMGRRAALAPYVDPAKPTDLLAASENMEYQQYLRGQQEEGVATGRTPSFIDPNAPLRTVTSTPAVAGAAPAGGAALLGGAGAAPVASGGVPAVMGGTGLQGMSQQDIEADLARQRAAWSTPFGTPASAGLMQVESRPGVRENYEMDQLAQAAAQIRGEEDQLALAASNLRSPARTAAPESPYATVDEALRAVVDTAKAGHITPDQGMAIINSASVPGPNGLPQRNPAATPGAVWAQLKTALQENQRGKGNRGEAVRPGGNGAGVVQGTQAQGGAAAQAQQAVPAQAQGGGQQAGTVAATPAKVVPLARGARRGKGKGKAAKAPVATPAVAAAPVATGAAATTPAAIATEAPDVEAWEPKAGETGAASETLDVAVAAPVGEATGKITQPNSVIRGLAQFLLGKGKQVTIREMKGEPGAQPGRLVKPSAENQKKLDRAGTLIREIQQLYKQMGAVGNRIIPSIVKKGRDGRPLVGREQEQESEAKRGMLSKIGERTAPLPGAVAEITKRFEELQTLMSGSTIDAIASVAKNLHNKAGIEKGKKEGYEKADLSFSQPWALYKSGQLSPAAVRNTPTRESLENIERVEGEPWIHPLMRVAEKGYGAYKKGTKQKGLLGILAYYMTGGTLMERTLAGALHAALSRNPSRTPKVVFGTQAELRDQSAKLKRTVPAGIIHGFYDKGSNTIYLPHPEEVSKKMAGATPATVLHEALHGTLQWFVEQYPNHISVQRLAKIADNLLSGAYGSKKYGEISDVLDQIGGATGGQKIPGAKATTDQVLELMSYALTHDKFKGVLSEIKDADTPMPEKRSLIGALTSFWDSMMNVLHALLGGQPGQRGSLATDIAARTVELLSDVTNYETPPAAPAATTPPAAAAAEKKGAPTPPAAAPAAGTTPTAPSTVVPAPAAPAAAAPVAAPAQRKQGEIRVGDTVLHKGAEKTVTAVGGTGTVTLSDGTRTSDVKFVREEGAPAPVAATAAARPGETIAQTIDEQLDDADEDVLEKAGVEREQLEQHVEKIMRQPKGRRSAAINAAAQRRPKVAVILRKIVDARQQAEAPAQGQTLQSAFVPEEGELTPEELTSLDFTLPESKPGVHYQLGRTAAVNKNVMRSKVSPKVEAILRGNGLPNIEGAGMLRDALEEMIRTAPLAVRAMARDILALMPNSGIILHVDDKNNREGTPNGAVLLNPTPIVTLYTARGRRGLSHETVLHEAWHAAVAVRYASLGYITDFRQRTAGGTPSPQARRQLEQFRRLHQEFIVAANADKAVDDATFGSLYAAMTDIDEFFVRAMTDPLLQAWLAGKEYPAGGTMWDRFKNWLKYDLLGYKRGTAPSWLDASLRAADELNIVMAKDAADFMALGEKIRVEGRARADAERAARGERRARGETKAMAAEGESAPAPVLHAQAQANGGAVNQRNLNYTSFAPSKPWLEDLFKLAFPTVWGDNPTTMRWAEDKARAFSKEIQNRSPWLAKWAGIVYAPFNTGPEIEKYVNEWKKGSHGAVTVANEFGNWVRGATPQQVQEAFNYMDNPTASSSLDAHVRQLARDAAKALQTAISHSSGEVQAIFKDLAPSEQLTLAVGSESVLSSGFNIQEEKLTGGTMQPVGESIIERNPDPNAKGKRFYARWKMLNGERVLDGMVHESLLTPADTTVDRATPYIETKGRDAERSKAEGEPVIKFRALTTVRSILSPTTGQGATAEQARAAQEQIANAFVNTVSLMANAVATRKLTNDMVMWGSAERQLADGTTEKNPDPKVFTTEEELRAFLQSKLPKGAPPRGPVRIINVAEQEAKSHVVTAAMRLPGNWVRVPESEGYGKLAGKVIEGPLWSRIQDSMNTDPVISWQFYNGAMRMFKKAKTVYNPATVATNVMTNFTLAFMNNISIDAVMSGLGLYITYKANPGMLTPDQLKLMSEFHASGATLGDFSVTEIKQMMYEAMARDDTEMTGVGYINDLARWMKYEDRLKRSVDAAIKKGKRGDEIMTQIYATTDNMFRFAAFISKMGELQRNAAQEGKVVDQKAHDAMVDEAGTFAKKAFLDYDIDSRAVKFLRQTIFPFISWPYAFAGVLGSIAKNQPWKLAALAGAYTLVTTALSAAMGGGGDDDEKRRKRENLADRTWFGARKQTYLGEWGGRHIYFDTARWFLPTPIDFKEQPNGFMGWHSWPSALTPSNPAVTALVLGYGLDPYTGKPLGKDTDDAFDAVFKRGIKIGTQMLPSFMAPRTGEMLPGGRVLRGAKPGLLGHEVSESAHYIRTLLAPVTAVDEAESRKGAELEIQRTERAFDTEISGIRRDSRLGKIPYEDFSDTLTKLRERKAERLKELRERL